VAVSQPSRKQGSSCLGVLQAVADSAEGKRDPKRKVTFNPFQKEKSAGVGLESYYSKALASDGAATGEDKANTEPTSSFRLEVKASEHARQQQQCPLDEEKSYFSDGQSTCLQLVCSLAGGVMEATERTDRLRVSNVRVVRCFQIAAIVCKARTVADFEQRVKYALGYFFNVMMVRVLFYNESADELLVSATGQQAQGARRQPKFKRKCKSFYTDSGIVGQAVRKRMVINVGHALASPYVDAQADGLDMAPRPLNSESNMMVGPMSFEPDDDKMTEVIVGVVQLVERIENHSGKSGRSAWDEGIGAGKDAVVERPGKDFTPEDELLFKTVLKVCGSVARRVLQLQQMTAANEGKTHLTLAQMLGG